MHRNLGGEITGAWPLPGKDQQGPAVEADGMMSIAQDSGGMLKIRWRRGVKYPFSGEP